MINLKVTKKQATLWKALQTRKYRYLLFGGGMGCFLPNTLVLCEHGKYKEIQYITNQDKVYTLNESTQQLELKSVLHKFTYGGIVTDKSIITFYLRNGEEISCTDNHEFYIGGRWVSARRIARGEVDVCSGKSQKVYRVKQGQVNYKGIQGVTEMGTDASSLIGRLLQNGTDIKREEKIDTCTQGYLRGMVWDSKNIIGSEPQRLRQNKQQLGELRMGHTGRKRQTCIQGGDFSYVVQEGERPSDVKVNGRQGCTNSRQVHSDYIHEGKARQGIWGKRSNYQGRIVEENLEAFELDNVVAVEERQATQDDVVYDLHVEDNHNYIVSRGNIIVHNSGKSYLGAILFLQFAMNFPNTRYAIVRKHMTTLKRTTYQTFVKVAQELNIPYKANRAEMFWDFPNGSRIYFIDADEGRDPDFNKLKGFELTAAMIDEANEVAEKAFNILIARIGRENPKGVHAFILLTCNPSDNWVKQRFYTPHSEDKLKEPYYFLQALAEDNQFLEEEYLKGLEDLPEAEYNRYVLGDWNFTDDPNQLIKFEWIKDNTLDKYDGELTHIGIDVAREGDDRTVFCFRSGDTYVKSEIFTHQDTITTAALGIERMKEHKIGAEKVKVDVIGVGGGVVDYMISQGYNVLPINSGMSPDKDAGHLHFRNVRAQMHWYLREELQKGTIKLVEDQDLFKELLNIRYFTKDKVIQIESKQEIKKRLGYSTDKADALLLAFHTPLVTPGPTFSFMG